MKHPSPCCACQPFPVRASTSLPSPFRGPCVCGKDLTAALRNQTQHPGRRDRYELTSIKRWVSGQRVSCGHLVYLCAPPGKPPRRGARCAFDFARTENSRRVTYSSAAPRKVFLCRSKFFHNDMYRQKHLHGRIGPAARQSIWYQPTHLPPYHNAFTKQRGQQGPGLWSSYPCRRSV